MRRHFEMWRRFSARSICSDLQGFKLCCQRLIVAQHPIQLLLLAIQHIAQILDGMFQVGTFDFQGLEAVSVAHAVF